MSHDKPYRMGPLRRRQLKARREYAAACRRHLRMSPGDRELDREGPTISRLLLAALIGVALVLFGVFLATRRNHISPFADAIGAPPRMHGLLR